MYLNSQWRACADIFIDEGLIDDQDQWAVVGIVRCEAPSLKQRNSERGEKAWRDIGESAWPIQRADVYVVSPGRAPQRNIRGRGGVLDPRNGAYIIQHLPFIVRKVFRLDLSPMESRR